MSDARPQAVPTVFRMPAGRRERARGAHVTVLLLGIAVGGGFMGLGFWALVGRSGGPVLALVFGLGGLGILVAAVGAVVRWRRNLREVADAEGVVLSADPTALSLGAVARVEWADVSEIVFRDRRTFDGGGFRGTPGAYGRVLGAKLRARGGKSELAVVVTRAGGAVVELPFGAALPVEAFHDAYRAVEPFAAERGAILRYDASATG